MGTEVSFVEKKGLPQEWLKLIACVTMLIDHIGAVFFPRMFLLRIIGRIAFPIYCFLIAEGAVYTHDKKKYALRLLIGVFLAELPFDFAFDGMFTWSGQSVMITLLLGYLAVLALQDEAHRLRGFAVFAGLSLAAEAMQTDYGGWGVAMVVLFSLTRGRKLLQTAGLAVVCFLMNSAVLRFGTVRIPIELFAVIAMIPISLYSGRKLTRSAAVQWAFYLFYPAHLTAICIMKLLLR